MARASASRSATWTVTPRCARQWAVSYDPPHRRWKGPTSPAVCAPRRAHGSTRPGTESVRLAHPSPHERTDRFRDQRTVDRSQPRSQEALFTHAGVLRDPARRVMSMHIDARAARSAAAGALPRPRLPRTAWRAAALLAAALAAVLAAAAPALAAQPGITQVSADPYTPATAPTGEHATEVEPDTFAFGSTLVSAFQTGRVFNGGATDIGWATSSDGGASWTHGFLPGTSREAMQPGPFFSVSDPSVAYDARDRVWIISWLGAHFSGGGVVDVMVSRSTDGGLTWGTPVTIAAPGVFYDKNWTACDNTAASPFYGHCYTEFDNASSGDLELMSTSADGGLSWGPPTPTADNIHGLGGQPVVL